MVARALAIAHTCVYDAWAAYDDVAVATTDTGGSRRQPTEERTDDNKAKAISFAAYRCLRNLYPDGSLPPPLAQPSVRLQAVLLGYGYSLLETCDLLTDEDCRNSDPVTAAGIGNIAAQAVIDARRHDGSNQYADLTPAPCPVLTPWPHPCAASAYGQTSANPTRTGAYSDYVAADYDPYVPTNPLMGYCNPLVLVCERQEIVDPNHWQPLIFSNGQACLDSGLGTEETCPGIQVFIAAHWGRVTPFELTPGHWGLFAQFISQRDSHTIDQDAKMFFAMHNASFDAGIVAWHIKRKYNGVRPITAIRFAKQGQNILAWGGPGRPIEHIPGEKWSPYNPGTNLTPSFPGYFSGHSVFSRSSATVLQLFTGSDDFGFSTVLPAGFGRVEPGIPPVPTTFSYATFSDAANEAGLSRLYGGIHFADDNTTAQNVGYLIGVQAWAKALTYFNVSR